MAKGTLIGGLIGLLITIPIWFYLLYKILVMVGASDLMWFLYWVYMPFTLVAQVLIKAAESKS